MYLKQQHVGHFLVALCQYFAYFEVQIDRSTFWASLCDRQFTSVSFRESDMGVLDKVSGPNMHSESALEDSQNLGLSGW